MRESAKIGRNAPCPCGSGRKYKRCCDDPSRWAGDSLWHRLRTAEGRVVAEVAGWAQERYGSEIRNAAWSAFLRGGDDGGEGSEHPEFTGLFLPWSLSAWTPGFGRWKPGDWPDEPLGLAFLHACGDRLGSLERRFLEEVCARPFSFHQVLDVEPQRSLRLRDLLCGEECRVSESLATGMVSRGAILFARVVSIDGVSILTGTGTYVMPPRFAQVLLDLREDLAQLAGPLGPRRLRELDDPLRQVYFDLVQEMQHPPEIELRNTDGDPFELIQLHYALRCPPERAFDALKGLALDHTEEELLADADRVAGRLGSVSFPWLERGNKKHKSWDNTILGHIAIRKGELRVDVNSRRRARRIRREIERRLDGEVVFDGESSQSAEALLAAADRDGPRKRNKRRKARRRREADPEVRELTEHVRRQHWESWLDEGIPALDGLTPRQAAREPRSRERLESLLLEFEWRDEQAPNSLAPDVGALRRELGL